MEKHLSKTNWCFCKGKEGGLRQEVPVENDIRETDWERELTVQNIQAKEKMAQELREMGFEHAAIARILYLEGVEREPEKGKRITHVHTGRRR